MKPTPFFGVTWKLDLTAKRMKRGKRAHLRCFSFSLALDEKNKKGQSTMLPPLEL
jgi:hypothetical protein